MFGSWLLMHLRVLSVQTSCLAYMPTLINPNKMSENEDSISPTGPHLEFLLDTHG